MTDNFSVFNRKFPRGILDHISLKFSQRGSPGASTNGKLNTSLFAFSEADSIQTKGIRVMTTINARYSTGLYLPQATSSFLLP